MADDLPPGYTADDVADLPPGYKPSDVAQDLPPGYKASDVAKQSPDAFKAGSPTQTIAGYLSTDYQGPQQPTALREGTVANTALQHQQAMAAADAAAAAKAKHDADVAEMQQAIASRQPSIHTDAGDIPASAIGSVSFTPSESTQAGPPGPLEQKVDELVHHPALDVSPVSGPLQNVPGTGVLHAAGVAAGRAVEDANQLTSPYNIGLLVGARMLPATAARLVGAIFTGQMTKDALAAIEKISSDSKDMSPDDITKTAVDAAVNGLFAYFGMKHGAAAPSPEMVEQFRQGLEQSQRQKIAQDRAGIAQDLSNQHEAVRAEERARGAQAIGAQGPSIPAEVSPQQSAGYVPREISPAVVLTGGSASAPEPEMTPEEAMAGRQAASERGAVEAAQAKKIAELDARLKEVEARGTARGYDMTPPTPPASGTPEHLMWDNGSVEQPAGEEWTPEQAEAAVANRPPNPEVAEQAARFREQRLAQDAALDRDVGDLPPGYKPADVVADDRAPNEDIRRMAREYNAGRGMPGPEEGQHPEVNPALAREIADAFDKLKTANTEDPRVARAYAALGREVQNQWDAIRGEGYDLEPWKKPGQPYANSAEMMKDLRDNHHLYFFQGGEPHPFMDQKDESGLSLNDKFRAVHDFFGHAAEGYQFGPKGEEGAWLRHSQMFGPEAQRAMSTETRGQNSWVNYGKQNFDAEGRPTNVPLKDRPFAEQKADLLPEHLTDWRATDKSLPPDVRSAVERARDWIAKAQQGGAAEGLGQSIKHINTGEELPTTRQHFEVIGGMILNDFKPKGLDDFMEHVAREVGPNALEVETATGKKTTLTPEKAYELAKRGQRRIAEASKLRGLTPYEDYQKLADSEAGQKTLGWYGSIRDLVEKHHWNLKDVSDFIRWENAYSANRGVEEAADLAIQAVKAQRSGVPVDEITKTIPEEARDITYHGDVQRGPKLGEYYDTKMAELGGPQPKRTVADGRMLESNGFTKMVKDAKGRMVEAANATPLTRQATDIRNRFETRRLGRTKIQEAQEMTWGGHQALNKGNPEANESMADRAVRLVEKHGGYDAVFNPQDAEFKFGENIPSHLNPEPIPFDHRTPELAFKELEPRTGRGNGNGEEAKREDRLPRSYVSVEGTEPEARFRSMKVGKGEIPPGTVYDLDKDPLHLKEQPREDMDKSPATELEDRILATGARGYKVGNTIAYFDRLPVNFDTSSLEGGAAEGLGLGVKRLQSAPKIPAGGRVINAVGEPEEHFDNYQAFLNRYGKSNLRETEVANPELARKLRYAAVAGGGADQMTKGFSDYLKGIGMKAEDFVGPATESNLRRDRARWERLADEVRNGNAADVAAKFGLPEQDPDNLGTPLKALAATDYAGKRGDLQKANAAYEKGDDAKLQQILGDAFEHASKGVGAVLPDADYQKALKDPKFQQALDYYRTNIEPVIMRAHLSNNGIVRPDLGDIGAYFPSTTPEDSDLSRLVRRRGTLAKPSNPWNKMSTGLAPEYVGDFSGLRGHLREGLRANAVADAIQSAQDAGLIKKFTGEKMPTSVKYQGRDFVPDTISSNIMPKWFSDELRPIFENKTSKWPSQRLQAVRDLVTKLGLVGPFDLVYHATNVLGAGGRISPMDRLSPLGKVLGAIPGMGGIPATLADTFGMDPRSDEFSSYVTKLREGGMLSDRYGAATYSKQIAEDTGTKQKTLSFEPALHGPRGLDIRARVAFYRVAEKMGMSPEETYHFVNNLGNYTYQLNGEIARAVKKAGLSPFVTAGQTMNWNGVVGLLSGQRMPDSMSKGAAAARRLSQAITSGGVGAMLTWAILNKTQTDKWPWEQGKDMKFMAVPVGKDKKGNVTYQSVLDMVNPLVSRGLRATGIRGFGETLAKGGTAGQAFDEGAKDIVNTWTHPLAGPPVKMATRAILGRDTRVSSTSEKSGKPSWDLDNFGLRKAEPGLDSVLARGEYALGGVNPLVEKGIQVAQGKKDAGSALEDIYAPRFQTQGNPGRKAAALKQGQRAHGGK